jgi:Ca2+-binding RTX toxin-like protein
VTLNLATGVHGGQAAGDALISIERFRLTTFNDVFTGSAAAELVFGDGGNDTVSGGGGNDDLRGEAGNDTIDGGSGADAMDGGIGNDTYVVDSASDTVIELIGEGTDTVQSAVGFSLSSRYIENLTLTGAGAINGTGNSYDNVITGNGAANSLSGQDGNDTLNGGAGIDSMSGGTGNDTYIVDNSSDTVSETSTGGFDTVQSSATFSLAGQYIEDLVLTGSGAVNGTGNTLANTIAGNGAANSLSGGDGADSLYGKGGNDTLTGGAAADAFYFDTALGAGNVDTIGGYSVADDTIMLSRAIFAAIGSDGTLAAGAFVTGAAAADAADRIVYDSASGKIFYDADGNGAGAAVLFAQVAIGTALTNLDFVGYTPA